jgi:hypothetical protein
VAATLSLKLEQTTRKTPIVEDELKRVETELRIAGGRIEETRTLCRKLLDETPYITDAALERAATEIVKQWPIKNGEEAKLETVLNSVFHEVALQHARELYEPLEALTLQLAEVLDAAARALNAGAHSDEERLDHALKEMPRLDLGTVDLDLRFNLLLSLGETIAKKRVEKELRKQTEPSFSNAVASYGKVLELWTAKVFEDLQTRFGERADWYRAQIGRLTGPAQISEDEKTKIRRDLEQLTQREDQAAPAVRTEFAEAV